MKNKKTIIISLIIVIFISLGLLGYFFLTREDKNTTLNLIDRKWIEANKNKIFDIEIVNNIPIFNYKGEGILFDFIKDIENDTKLDFNPISFGYGKTPENEYAIKIVREMKENDILIYEDNYVLVSKENNKYNGLPSIKNVTVGVLKNDIDLISKYINTDITVKTYETFNELYESFKLEDSTLNLIAIPRTAYLEHIISGKDIYIVYNITDLKEYYVLSLGSNDKLNTIIKKYFNKWKTEKYEESFNRYLNKNYFTFKGIDETERSKLKSKTYIYGFVNNPPYDVLHNNKLLGINSSLIKSFTKLTGAELEIKKYHSISSMLEAFNENKLDFIFNNYSNTEYKMDVANTTSFYNEKIVVLSNIKNNITVNSINSIKDKEVTVVSDSRIEQLLAENGNLLKKYNNLTELVSKINDNSILAIDYYSYYYYDKNKLENFKVDYEFIMNSDYNYTMRDINDNKLFNDYFDFYLSFINEKEHINNAYVKLFSIKQDKEENNILNVLFLIIVILLLLIISLKRFIFRKKRKKRSISMTKTDKLKYIDVLTSLKNRNYLNDHIEIWDDNQVYPQAVVIIDLNNVAYINDNYGYQEGDNVIKEAANTLIKNQVENTEIVRTDGNEFLIYMVGYEEKQVLTFIRKVLKELKDLAHGFGATAGYSIISDEIKTVDDAINEATLDMKNNKEDASN